MAKWKQGPQKIKTNYPQKKKIGGMKTIFIMNYCKIRNTTLLYFEEKICRFQRL